ncbi:MAG: Eco57I restriction-modification methylase domain-containing protein, partial [bacterium]
MLERIKELLNHYRNLQSAKDFFAKLGYPIHFIPFPEFPDLPQSAQNLIHSAYLISDIKGAFRIYHLELNSNRIRRTDIRKILEPFYRKHPNIYSLFVFSPSQSPYDELAFVSPIIIPHPRHRDKVRLHLRTLPLNPLSPYRTDLEILNEIRLDRPLSPEEIWNKHEHAFSVQRVTKQFYEDYKAIFEELYKFLKEKQGDAFWAHSFAHQLLNRIMFIYFIQKKGWLLGENGEPARNFMRQLWNAFKSAKQSGKTPPDSFYSHWLTVLFFSAFNKRFQARHEYQERFPGWLINSLSQAPYLNGGLYLQNKYDEQLRTTIPDEFFELLFDKGLDGTSPGFFERYNFTVVESGRFDEEVAVDPEVIGKVYESLVNIQEREGEEGEIDRRGLAGIFYTPRVEIDLMCRLSLVDYLINHLGSAHKDCLYKFVFAYDEEDKEEADRDITERGLWKDIDELLRGVKVCDPACGSGSFLVGMLLVLDDEQKRANFHLGKEETAYERRKRIIRDQLYGVDIMEWAVHIAELRLWLQLVVETELPREEIHHKPLLPNLSFKVRPGDSLIQEIGGINFSRFSEYWEIPSQLKKQLRELMDRKRRYYEGEKDLTEDKLKNEEKEFFLKVLDKKVRDLLKERGVLKRKLALPPQSALPGYGQAQPPKEKEKWEKELKEIERKIEELNELSVEIKGAKELPFLWNFAFAEIFADDKKGFDIVIGNPPYVRQEKIAPPNLREEDFPPDEWRRKKEEYKRKLQESVAFIYPDFFRNRRLDGRSDLYIYFYFHALSLLNPKGSFCFITSNSWLDVEFGRDLQEFLLRFGHPKMIIDNRAKRSFEQADVNTVIVLLAPASRKELSEEEMEKRLVRFVTFYKRFEEIVHPVIFMEIGDERKYKRRGDFWILRMGEYRAIMKSAYSLYVEGTEAVGIGLGRYVGNKWGGKYLRAPEIYYRILEKGAGKLVKLGDIAEVRRGFTTGANDFFYLEPVGMSVKEVAEIGEKKRLVRVRNGAGWEGEIEAGWLRPV